MGTLGRSVVAGRPAAFGCTAGAFLRPCPCLLSHSKLYDIHPLPLVSRRASARSSPLSSLSAELGVDPESQETQIQPSSEMDTVRVLFQLQKTCVFGQHFFLVGDDPVLGVWDPERAIPLVWSDGHLWSAEMSLPVGKTILFKFILKGPRGEVAWQPGPDRILKTWETKNSIVISEDWDNVELQKINEEVLLEQTGNVTTVPSLLTENEVDVAETEEVITSEEDERSIIIDQHQPLLVPGLISASSSTVEQTGNVTTVPSLLTENEVDVAETKEVITSEEEERSIIIDQHQPVLVPGLISACSSTVEQTGNVTTVPSFLTENEVDAAETEEVITSEEDERSIIIDEHQPVLVPGLISASSSTVEETVEDVEDIKFVPPITSDEPIEGITLKEEEEELLDESEKSVDPLHMVKPDEGNGESAVNMASESSEGDQATEGALVTDDVIKNDIQWGRKSLLQFILNLGFQNNQLS